MISELFGILSNIPLESPLYPKLHGMLGEEIKQLDATWRMSRYRVPEHDAKAKVDNHGMTGGSSTAAVATNSMEPELFSRAVVAMESLAKNTSSIDSCLGDIHKLLVGLFFSTP